ncbi:hypothetical protein JOL62DRAFT_586600 [Phyllosticta paracitricarpa]|uniref:Uncharacterized protein n=1 Tax=Phyllosticta paracitricarpa TaxID=2016321 RepID=A0ABR1MUN9_9PEZI
MPLMGRIKNMSLNRLERLVRGLIGRRRLTTMRCLLSTSQPALRKSEMHSPAPCVCVCVCVATVVHPAHRSDLSQGFDRCAGNSRCFVSRRREERRFPRRLRRHQYRPGGGQVAEGRETFDNCGWAVSEDSPSDCCEVIALVTRLVQQDRPWSHQSCRVR